ncbi:matrix metalloproteinase-28 isoform X1 [Anas platyrhynchos]|uniref:matrix metalloproteinase-28 isoform X1 n=1 Tax=Anas platyrhynchos TaxID=8839 RepID=UPI003AF206CA
MKETRGDPGGGRRGGWCGGAQPCGRGGQGPPPGPGRGEAEPGPAPGEKQRRRQEQEQGHGHGRGAEGSAGAGAAGGRGGGGGRQPAAAGGAIPAEVRLPGSCTLQPAQPRGVHGSAEGFPAGEPPPTQRGAGCPHAAADGPPAVWHGRWGELGPPRCAAAPALGTARQQVAQAAPDVPGGELAAVPAAARGAPGRPGRLRALEQRLLAGILGSTRRPGRHPPHLLPRGPQRRAQQRLRWARCWSLPPRGALAHAFFPRRGEAHFDSAERWSLRSGKGRNLFVVVAHEVGHTLGLEHSPARSALMSPYYKKLSKDFVLSWDDILAIQNLYGKPSRGSAIQLPGRVFTHFQDWSGDLYGEDRQRQGASTYYCHSFFDAVTADVDDNLYIFKGGHFWVVPASGNASQPQPLHARWPGLPAGIDACACSPLSHSFYFFKGGRCWRYQGSTLLPGFPQKCSARGLPRHPDTALYFQRLRRLVLFKGAKYFVASEESLSLEPYYPRSLRDWDGVPPGTTGALARRDGSVYFFRDERYWRFDQAKLRVVATGKWATQLPWMGCWDANGGQALF